MKTDPRRPLLLFVPAVLLLGVAPLAGQDQPSIVPGDRVRVHQVGSPAVTASLLWITPDSLTYAVDPDDVVGWTVSSHRLKRLEVSRGPATTGEGFSRGLGRGLMIGGAVGGVVGLFVATSCDGFVCFGPEVAVPAGILFYGLLGGVVGGMIGASNPGERWERVDYPARMTLSPDAAVALRLTVAIPR